MRAGHCECEFSSLRQVILTGLEWLTGTLPLAQSPWSESAERTPQPVVRYSVLAGVCVVE
jgi:hypothetical protein